MLSLARSLRSPRGLTPRSAGGWPHRHRRTTARIRRLGALLAAVVGIVGIAAAGWILAGGDPSSAWPLTAHPAAAFVEIPAGGVPVHLDSVPSGADVMVDGVRRGQTPLVAFLVPGQHTYTLRHPDTLEVTQTLDVADTGASAVVRMWRQRRTQAGGCLSGGDSGRRTFPGRRAGGASDQPSRRWGGLERTDRNARSVALGPVDGTIGAGNPGRS